ncbi:MAG: hypothetical protein ACI4RG_09235 [Huintestinicola sp.]
MDIEKIISQKDHTALLQLDDDSLDDLLMQLIYESFGEAFPERLNDVQMNIYLCSRLEDSVQADTLYSFVEDGMGEYLVRTAEAYENIGAPETAALIRKAAELIPQEVIDGEEPDDELLDKLMELDSSIGDYPDGIMRDIYRQYARAHLYEIL